MHLLGQRSLCFRWLDRFDLHDLDGMCPGPMASSHVAVALGDGTGAAHVTILTVHVVGAGSGVVSDPDSKVLDLCGR